ncbi:oligopeptide transporter [Atractiella rhizophila]|nr:oligopeptide transporter [Atractiella rhizophila]
MSGIPRDETAEFVKAKELEAVAYDPDKKDGAYYHESGTVEEADAQYVYPTEEEKRTLRHVEDTFPLVSYLIAIVECAERFSYYGCVIVFTNFIQRSLPPGSTTGAGKDATQSGALGQGQQAAVGLTTFNSFWVYTCPLLGGYLADTYWGRYKTVCIAVGVAIIGHILLVISSVPSVIKHPDGALACFSIAIVIMGLGTGAFKATISPLVAEQYKPKSLHVITKKSGERVIVNPYMTATKIYMYFYLFINVGALGGQISMVYAEKYVGFWLAYLLPTCVFLLTPTVLLLGKNRYVRSPPEGSVVVGAFRLWRYAAAKKWSWNPLTAYRQMNTPDFWEDAKPSKIVGPKPTWMTFDDVWVDEVRRGFKACYVFTFYPLWWLTYNQINNNLVSQAAEMDTNGLPNDIIQNLDPLFLIVFIPICQIIIFPFLKRIGINFTPLKRITAGFFVGTGAMIWAAVVQHYIYVKHPCGDHPAACEDQHAPLNVWIQSGSYVLIALSEIFASITGLEYAFTKAPKNMRSFVMAYFFFMSGIGSALNEALVPLSKDPELVKNYAVAGGLSTFGGICFWLSFRKLDKQELELNEMAAGELDARHDAPSEEKKA